MRGEWLFYMIMSFVFFFLLLMGYFDDPNANAVLGFGGIFLFLFALELKRRGN